MRLTLWSMPRANLCLAVKHLELDCFPRLHNLGENFLLAYWAVTILCN